MSNFKTPAFAEAASRRQANVKITKESIIEKTYFSPFTLSLSFDFAQDIRENPIMVSLSNHGLSTNGLFFLYMQLGTD